MGDNTVWIAGITGATAIVSGWLTSRSGARALRYQTDSAARSRREEQQLERQRAAYATLIEHIHTVGALHGEAQLAVAEPDPQLRADQARDPSASCHDSTTVSGLCTT
ncbi:hypothetical protein [Kitasatospora sp. NPDC047058]|uniref:hypothetical protein n=1 Tax=Kitasatospora sp. NPDC047058 TaxID=3155620 RepID=UPI0033DD6ECB